MMMMWVEHHYIHGTVERKHVEASNQAEGTWLNSTIQKWMVGLRCTSAERI